MSKKIDEGEMMSPAVPFFAHLLTSERDPAALASNSGPAPTYHCLDSECTKKYPSDGDEPTSPTYDK